MAKHVDEFLSSEEQEQVVSAIKEAELKTSGEIRVHIEEHHDDKPLERATQLFGELAMHETAQRNGVLIYVATEDHQFAIVGDEGIDAVTPEDFWESTKNIMQELFRSGRFADGLVAGIMNVGTELHHHFPYEDGDENELSDEISTS
jgi:uncharacterized membrane protein